MLNPGEGLLSTGKCSVHTKENPYFIDLKKYMLVSMSPCIRATTQRPTAAPRMEGVGQRVYRPLLGVADTNHLLSIHIWVVLGNAEQLI